MSNILDQLRRHHRGSRQHRLALRLLSCFQDSNSIGNPEITSLIEKILDSPEQIPHFLLLGHCLNAEIKRVKEEYDHAEEEYLIAIRIGESIPQEEWAYNEWFCHWFPRALLGLFTVRRRMLHIDLDWFRNHLERLSELRYLPIPDLGIQTKVAESAFLRQTGKHRTALGIINRAIAEGEHYNIPYFNFWELVHFESHRLLICLSSPDLFDQTFEYAEYLHKRIHPDYWVKTAALAAMVHVKLKRIVDQMEARSESSMDAKMLYEEVDYFKEMNACAPHSHDPSIITEAYYLNAFAHIISDCPASAVVEIKKISEIDMDPNLTLLRASEISLLALLSNDQSVRDASEDLKHRGRGALRYLVGLLTIYGLGKQELYEVSRWLQPTFGYEMKATALFQPILLKLRARLWP